MKGPLIYVVVGWNSDEGEPGRRRRVSSDAIAMLDAGRVFYMVPPPGAPAYAAAQALDARLLLQVRQCAACGARVLFA